MLAEIYSSGVLGVDAYLVEVEVDVIRTTGDQVRFSVVGLPDMAVQESRERVRSAIKNSGFSFPMARLTVNLAPEANAAEGAVVRGIAVYPVKSLSDAAAILAGTSAIAPLPEGDEPFERTPPGYDGDFADVKGQDQAK